MLKKNPRLSGAVKLRWRRQIWQKNFIKKLTDQRANRPTDQNRCVQRRVFAAQKKPRVKQRCRGGEDKFGVEKKGGKEAIFSGRPRSQRAAQFFFSPSFIFWFSNNKSLLQSTRRQGVFFFKRILECLAHFFLAWWFLWFLLWVKAITLLIKFPVITN